MRAAALLLGVLGLAAAAAEPPVTLPAANGEFTIYSRATTPDSLTVRTTGPSELLVRHVVVAAGGTTGLERHPGTAVVIVDHGSATAVRADGGDCATRSVGAGSAVVQPAGSVGEIRNAGGEALSLYVVTVTPASEAQPQQPSTGPCPAAAAGGVVSEIVDRSVIGSPVTEEWRGPLDLYVGIVHVPSHRTAFGWHVHPGPVFVGVARGDMTLRIVDGGRCSISTFAPGAGGIELADHTHDVSNEGDTQLDFHFLAIAPAPRPVILPQPSPTECAS
jgi:quercetin dioxygenase-like cupin family protein